MRIKFLFLLLFLVSNVYAQIDTVYSFKQLSLGGGTRITGLYQSNSNTNIIYAKSPYGGLFKYNKNTGVWNNLLLDLPYDYSIAFGVEGFAIDPNNNQIIYAALGKYYYSAYDTGSVWKSIDAGLTWNKTSLAIPMFASVWQKAYQGERLVIDPVNSNRIYFASRMSGLWVSNDAGSTWAMNSSLPFVADSIYGITSVALDPTIVSSGTVQRIYVSIQNVGVYMSNNAGISWMPISTTITNVNQLKVTSNGTMYAADDYGLYKYNAMGWQYITPTLDYYMAGVSLDPNNVNHICLLTRHPWASEAPVYESYDAGNNWTNISYAPSITDDVSWWKERYFNDYIQATLIDRDNSATIWIANDVGVQMCENTNAMIKEWKGKNKGLESSMTYSGISTPNAMLGVSSHDIGGFSFKNMFDAPTQISVGDQVTCTGIDFCKNKPNYWVQVGFGDTEWPPHSVVGYSSDAGKTWSTCNNPPTVLGGKIAVSSNDTNNMVLVNSSEGMMYTLDRGNTWNISSGLSGTLTLEYWGLRNEILISSDPDQPNRFIFFDHINDIVYESLDKGVSFHPISTLAHSSNNYVHVLKNNKVIISTDYNGVYSSSDGGATFSEVGNLMRYRSFSIGKENPTTQNPTLYAFGFTSWASVDYQYFRSDDLGNTWKELNIDKPFINETIRSIVADNKKFGRFFILTEGQGVWVAEIAGTEDTLTYIATEDKSKQVQSIIFPNPSRMHVLAIKSPNHLQGNLEIINTFGQIVKKINVDLEAENNYTIPLETQNLTSGMYLLYMQTQDSKIPIGNIMVQ